METVLRLFDEKKRGSAVLSAANPRK